MTPIYLRRQDLYELLCKNELPRGPEIKIILEPLTWKEKEKVVKDAKLDTILPKWGTPECEDLLRSGSLADYVRKKSEEK